VENDEKNPRFDGKHREKPGKTGNNCVFFVDALFHDPTGRDPSWSRAPYVIQLRMDNEGGIWCVARHIKGVAMGSPIAGWFISWNIP